MDVFFHAGSRREVDCGDRSQVKNTAPVPTTSTQVTFDNCAARSTSCTVRFKGSVDVLRAATDFNFTVSVNMATKNISVEGSHDPSTSYEVYAAENHQAPVTVYQGKADRNYGWWARRFSFDPIVVKKQVANYNPLRTSCCYTLHTHLCNTLTIMSLLSYTPQVT